MSPTEKLNTHQKALHINLDLTSFGSFAEIGAGQEVVRWFMVVGGASGTVAKSISAYDKEVSDDLYGSGARYVSGERLQAMLDSEWSQLITQLNKSRGSNTRFFAFVDTISARNYAGSNEPHGWIGLRFQLQPGGQPNDIIVHVNLRDLSNPLEQEAVGILGVNLIYAVFYQLKTRESFFENIAQDVEKRIEIDYAEVRGTAFEGWNQRAILTQLVCAGLAEAVCFPCSGPPVPPIEVLHKKAAVLAPGSFEHVDPAHAAIHNQLLASGIQQLRGELAGKDSGPIGFFGFSAMPLREEDPPPRITDLMERIDVLHAHCGDVLLFRERELYGMTTFVSRYTKEPIRFVLGLSLLVRIWEYRYNKLPGSFLEALSRLLPQNVRIYAHPMSSRDLQDAVQSMSATDWQWTDTNGWVSARQLHPPLPLGHLYDYVLASNFLVPLEIPGALKTSE
ncbi:MAG: hypothetical protein ABSD67_09780 [Terracidiphilus sp.]|jgi:hypothetical protein